MNITQLEYFLAASRLRNFTRAAEEMFTSRQNLSHAVHDLESELGVTLFATQGGSLVLTAEGREAAERAQRIIDEVRGLKRAFAVRSSDSAPLSVIVGLNLVSCTAYDFATSVETYGVPVKLNEYPCKTCYEMVVDGRADVAIVGCMDRRFDGCEHRLISSDSLYFLVNSESDLARKEAIDVADLAGHRLTMLPDFEFQFEPFVKAYIAHGMNLDAVDVISNVGFMLRTVRNNDAVGIASASFRENAPNGTMALPFANASMPMNLYALYRSASENAAAIDDFIFAVSHTL